jgi:hypothetical protein
MLVGKHEGKKTVKWNASVQSVKETGHLGDLSVDGWIKL